MSPALVDLNALCALQLARLRALPVYVNPPVQPPPLRAKRIRRTPKGRCYDCDRQVRRNRVLCSVCREAEQVAMRQRWNREQSWR